MVVSYAASAVDRCSVVGFEGWLWIAKVARQRAPNAKLLTFSSSGGLWEWGLAKKANVLTSSWIVDGAVARL